MNWQVEYALRYFVTMAGSAAESLGGDVIRIRTEEKPDVVAAITAEYTVTAAIAKNYKEQTLGIDFLCGYRKESVWEGAAIDYLESNRVGWGSFGTLTSAISEENANFAAHKTFRFADRLLRQHRHLTAVNREYDRVHSVTLRSGKSYRIGMIADYEPTADAVRSLWERFAPIDIIWNINPNGSPQPIAAEAARDLGCEVMKWGALKDRLK